MTALLLGYKDIEAARRFFIEALGFEEDFALHDDDGRLTSAFVTPCCCWAVRDRMG